MRLKLTLDRGNTCIKAALWSEDGQLVARELGDESQSAGDLVEQLASRHLAEGEIFDAIAWCTVVESEHADDEASLVGKARRVIELTAATPMHLRIAYQTPATLGSDRIAAALGAIAVAGTRRPILVSDIGTAVTYDYVAVGSHYLGGNIAPGIGLRLRALAAFTDALPAVDVNGGEIPVWGILPSRRRQRRNSRHNRRISRASCKSQFTHIRLHIRPLPRSQGSLQHYKR